MSKIPFDEKEMTIAYTVPNMLDPTIPESCSRRFHGPSRPPSS